MKAWFELPAGPAPTIAAGPVRHAGWLVVAIDGTLLAVPDSAANLTVPLWLRLTRSGDTFTAYTSPDGRTWSLVGQDTSPSFGSVPCYPGMAVTSRNASALDTIVFDNVTIG